MCVYRKIYKALFLRINMKEERRIKKEFAIKTIKELMAKKKYEYKSALLILMSKMNMSRRFTKEYLDMALLEINNG